MSATDRWQDGIRRALFKVTMGVLFPLATRLIRFDGKCGKS